jgi:hypothetical protein
MFLIFRFKLKIICLQKIFNMYRVILIVLVSFVLFSCKDDKPVSLKGKDLSTEIIPVKDLPLPPSCEYLPVEWVADRFKLDPETINVKDGEAGAGMSGCFFRWSTMDKPNAGVFVQVFTNPIEEEAKNWASLKMDGLKAGQAGSIENESSAFKDFPGIGDEGAFNEKMSVYYWRVGENYVFMLAFNMTITPEEQYKHAQAISEEVMKNFKNMVSK